METLKIYRIEHPSTGQGYFRTDLNDLCDSIVEYEEVSQKYWWLNSLTNKVGHNNPHGEALCIGDTKLVGKLKMMFYNRSRYDECYKKDNEEISKILRNTYKDCTAICGIRHLRDFPTWIVGDRIDYIHEALKLFQELGFILYEIEINCSGIYEILPTQVCFFRQDIVSKNEISFVNILSEMNHEFD